MCPEGFVDHLKNGLIQVLKPEQISDRPEFLGKYSKDYSFSSGGSPFLAVFPHSREEVQAVVKLANENRIPLVPVSSGPPHFHGDTLPEQGGIVVDFSHMKRIIKIDATNRYVWLEPGVTFGELMPALKKQGLKLDAPLLPRSSKSVLTSRLEREPVLIPKYQYDYIDPLLTLEVIYGSGELFRTGSASGPGPLDTLKADKVNPWGPGSVDYFRFISGAQGTMGLVTWAITKVEVLPLLQRLYFVPLEDVKLLAELMNQLLRKRVVDECLALNNVNLAIMLARNRPADYDELKKNLPDWTLMVCVAGYQRRPEERIVIQENNLKEICASFGLKPSTILPGARDQENVVLDLISAPWPEEPYWKLRLKGFCQDIFFLSTLSQMPKLIEVMKGVIAVSRSGEQDIGGYIQPMVQGRGCHCEFNLFCAESDIAEYHAARQLFLEASETLMRNGAFFSRPYGAWATMVYRDSAEEVIALTKLKRIFDPNNILNPGKLCF